MQNARVWPKWIAAWLGLTLVLAVALRACVWLVDSYEIETETGFLLSWWMYPAGGAVLASAAQAYTGVVRLDARWRQLVGVEKQFSALQEAAIRAVKCHRPEGFREDIDLASSLEAAQGVLEKERGPFRERWEATPFPFGIGFEPWTGTAYTEYEPSWHGVRGLVLRWRVTRRCLSTSGGECGSNTWAVRYMPHLIEPQDQSTKQLERQLAAMSQGMPRKPTAAPAETEDDGDGLAQ
jgi:hypothetical protein